MQRAGVTGLVLSCLASGMLAGADPALCEISVAPTATLVEHFKSTPLGQVLADPQSEPLHHSFEDNALSELVTGPVADTLTSQDGLGIRIFHLRAPDNAAAVDLAACGVFGTDSVNLYKSWRALLDLPAVPTSTADEAAATLAWQLLRHGSVLALSSSSRPLEPWTVDTGGNDLSVVVHGAAVLAELMTVLPTRGDFRAAVQGLFPASDAPGVITLNCSRSGITTRAVSPWRMAGLKPLKPAAFASVPSDCVQLYALGCSASTWWQAYRGVVLGLCPVADDDASAPSAVDTIVAREQAWDRHLQGLGLPSLQEILAGVDGTTLLMVTPRPPFGGYSLQLTRTPALDHLLTALLKTLPGAPLALPADGTALSVANPAWPIAVQLLLTPGSCLISSDPLAVADYPHGAWSSSPAGQAVLSHLTPGTVAVQGGDTRSTLITLIQLASSSLNNLELSQAICQAGYAGLKRLSVTSPPEWLTVTDGPHGLNAESQGLFITGMGPVVALGAAGLDGLLANRPELPGDVVISNLRLVVMTAETSFQTADYMDEDSKGIGEFGFFSEMNGGLKDQNNQPLQLIDNWFEPANTGGFRYVIYLPDGPTSCLADPQPKARAGSPAGIELRRKQWVCYAYPTDAPPPGTGPAAAPAVPVAPVAQDRTWMYAIDQSGNIYRSRFHDAAPAWNDLYGGKSWASPICWPLVSSP